MSTYYVKIKGSTICDSDRTERGSDNTNVTNWNINHPFIYCVAIGQDGRDPPSAVLKLQWRVSGGSYADLGATGAIKYTTATNLTNDNAVTSGEAKVSVSNMNWQDGWEVEDGVAPAIDLNSDYYSELQFACDPIGATVGSTYEFQLYNNTQGAAVVVESGSMITIKMSDHLSTSISDSYKHTDAIDPFQIYLIDLGISVADCCAPQTKLGG